MTEFSSLPPELLSLINNSSKNNGLHVLLSFIFKATESIGFNLRNGGYSSKAIGSINNFGDKQLDVDIKTDAVIFQALKDSMLVFSASSEENPLEIPCGGEGFSVGFDPLDGSSIIDANFAVGTILGIWPGKGLLNRYGSEQSCSLIVQYGPRVSMILALNSFVTVTNEAISVELTLINNNWEITIPKIVISSKAKTFAPGNLRATADNSNYKDLVNYWIENKYTLRYSGGLVPDVYHILIKGEGVLSNASSKNAKAKLRLLFECSPIALIIEAAGGLSCVCGNENETDSKISSSDTASSTSTSILDLKISDLDKRIGVCYGSKEEVERFKKFIFQ